MRSAPCLTSLAPFFAAGIVALSGGSARADDVPEVARARAAMTRGDFAAADKELASVKPAKAEALLLRARLELETGRYAAAAVTARSAAGQGGKARLDAAPLRAEALAAQGKLDEAIAAVREVENEDEARRARLVLGELLIRTGKRAAARAPLMTLIEDYNADKITQTDAEGLSMVGRAAHLLRSPRDANDAFNAAERAGAKTRVETLLWRAELFLDKYDPGHAGEVVREALKLEKKNPEAHVAMARVLLDNAMDFEAAESELKQALEVNPNLAAAYAVRAGLALRDMDLAASDAALDRGLQVDPTDLELLSMKAAVRFLADDPAGFDAVKKKVFGLTPEFSRFFQIASEFAEWEHRYDDIVRMAREAVQIDPGDAKSLATLGLNLIRGGDEKAGLDALKKAWDKDHFNVRVFNTLNLYDKAIALDYVTVDGQPFTIRYRKDERPILERYVPRMLAEAWRSMVGRYHFTPTTPVSIELYADTESFSVRTSGLPNVGIQGVCFGRTLAAMSPSAGPFNWGNVLWHELGHVFAIQLSKSHVPRWFTEGLSEYETIIRRPEWQREEDPALYAGLRGGRIPPVDGFNRAFTHVDSVEDVTMAYYAASQILVFLAQEFGFEKIVAMLPKWGAGERTPEVVREALGIGPEELDRRYRAWLEKKLVRYDKQFVPDLHAPPLDDARKAALADPKSAKKQVALALALLADRQVPEAEAVLAEALRLDPKQPDAHFVKVRLALAEKNLTEATRLLAKMIADGNDGYAVRMRSADVAEAQNDEPRMKQHLEAAARLDPTQVEPLQGLYDLAHKKHDEAGELDALRKLALLDQHDRRVWRKLLELLVKRGAWEEARKVGEGAMFVDVKSPAVHRLYARALARSGQFLSAIYELNSAILCKPKPADAVAIYGELAKGYDKLGEAELAKQARELAKQVAPGDAGEPDDEPGDEADRAGAPPTGKAAPPGKPTGKPPATRPRSRP
jgi:tetratricopeptide (TPR) repeat protein